MSLQYAVIGLGEFGRSVLNALILEGCDVIAIDQDENKIQEISPLVTYSVAIDAADESALISAGIKTVDVAIVGMGRNIQASIMITLLLKELGIKKIVAKAANFMHGKALRKIGAHKIVYPEIDMGERVAKSIVSENVYEQIELVQGYALVELLVPSKYIGEKIKDSNIRTKFNLNIVAIFHNYSETDKSKMKILVPQADYEFKEKDVMIVFGEEKDIDKFKK